MKKRKGMEIEEGGFPFDVRAVDDHPPKILHTLYQAAIDAYVEYLKAEGFLRLSHNGDEFTVECALGADDIYFTRTLATVLTNDYYGIEIEKEGAAAALAQELRRIADDLEKRYAP